MLHKIVKHWCTKKLDILYCFMWKKTFLIEVRIQNVMIMGEGNFPWFHWVSRGTCRTHDGICPGQVPAKTDCLG